MFRKLKNIFGLFRKPKETKVKQPGVFGKIFGKIFRGKKAPDIIPVELEKTEAEEDITSEADVIIENFRQYVKSMIEDDYTLKYGHSFTGVNKRRTAGGTDAKAWSAEQIIGYGNEIGGVLGEAIDAIGKEAVAQNIQNNGEYLQELAEQLIFAIYESRYAKWGGGKSAYVTATTIEIKLILTGENNI